MVFYKNNFFNIFVGLFLFILIVFVILSQNNMTKNDISTMEKYKSSIESSYVNGKFTQNYIVVESNYHYIVTLHKNTITLKHNGFFDKNRALVSLNLSANYSNGEFIWKCSQNHITSFQLPCGQ